MPDAPTREARGLADVKIDELEARVRALGRDPSEFRGSRARLLSYLRGREGRNAHRR